MSSSNSVSNKRPLLSVLYRDCKIAIGKFFSFFVNLLETSRKSIADFKLPVDSQIDRADQEFLPAAIEILERPGSPIAFIFLKLIAAFTGIALLWGVFGWTDIVAVARGKIQPAGRIKLVQPIEVGRVSKINVQNGDEVQEGDALIELDPVEAQADETALIEFLASSRAESARRQMVIRAADTQDMQPLEIAWWAGIPQQTRLRETGVGAADLRNLSKQVQALDAQTEQKRAERQRLINTIKAQERLIQTLQERVDMRSSLLKTDSGTRASVIDAMETLHNQMTILEGQRGQVFEADRAIDALIAERNKIIANFISENTMRANEADRQAIDYEQRLLKAQAKRDHMTLRSPSHGIVHAMSVTSLGQVLQPGQEVLRVIPQRGDIEIEVYVENKDIGFIHEGQEAYLKIEAFPYTRYGILEARVLRVGKDAIPDPDARQIEADPSKPAETRAQAGAQHVQSLVFPVTIKTEQKTIFAEGRHIPLSAGMALTAEIKTGQRRIIDYLLSPIQEMNSESLHER